MELPRPAGAIPELSAAKDFITELRQKRASYRSIADLLTRHGLPIGKTAVAAFCHVVLARHPFQQHRPRKRHWFLIRPMANPLSRHTAICPIGHR